MHPWMTSATWTSRRGHGRAHGASFRASITLPGCGVADCGYSEDLAQKWSARRISGGSTLKAVRRWIYLHPKTWMILKDR